MEVWPAIFLLRRATNRWNTNSGKLKYRVQCNSINRTFVDFIKERMVDEMIKRCFKYFLISRKTSVRTADCRYQI